MPVLSGDKRTYTVSELESYFHHLHRQSPTYRLLQLRGVVGYLATAYQTAKEGLERKFGGKTTKWLYIWGKYTTSGQYIFRQFLIL